MTGFLRRNSLLSEKFPYQDDYQLSNLIAVQENCENNHLRYNEFK
jgi:hypothetical protein